MDSAYDRKFEEMKKYIPFLESMIKRLENTRCSTSSINPRQAQLDKIRSLRDLLLNKNKRMKMENLLKCEQVLVNLYAKVERDTSSNVKLIPEQPIVSKDKSELETVRNKLKTVAKIQDGAETLPEIARANDIELNYSGSKEPALFQRRPNKSSIPSECAQNSSSDTNNRPSQSFQRRNYTRVLVSPEQSPLRWSASEHASTDKPLFSRRSPPKASIIPSSPLGKKEKKKSKTKSRKINDLNITLNVPQESLDSLNTEDILPRILNCKDGDVDIDTLRDLRTQILSELKQTGKNDDISDLILKSYNIKSDPRKKVSAKSSKQDVEEGELSDSESEAIESVYANLPANDALVKTSENKDQQRKIQICFVISDKPESNSAIQTNEPSQIIDLVSELEMCTENESEKKKSIYAIDSDESSSPKNKEIINTSHVKRKIDTVPPEKKLNMEEITECITLEDENEIEKPKSIEVLSIEDTDESLLQNHPKNRPELKECSDSSANGTTKLSINNTLNNDVLEPNLNEHIQATSEQQPKFVANFYKPIEEQQSEFSTSSSKVLNTLQEKDKALEKNTIAESKQLICGIPTDVTVKPPEKQLDNDSNKDTLIVTDGKSSHKELSPCVEKETQDDSQNIPLLNEPTVPPKAKTSVLYEIDILQALKNEILSESISVPGTEVTPALHQPKLTKVANAQEVMPKKKISIEKYKEKLSSSTTKSLFLKKRNRANITKEDLNKKQSLKLTDKECERFNLPKRMSLDDDDDIDDISDDDFFSEDKEDSLGLDDIYGDLAPKSPDDAISNRSNTPPIIIPTDQKSFEASAIKNKNDVDMRRVLLPTSLPQPNSQPVSAPITMGLGAMPASPVYGIDRNFSEVHVDSSKKLGDVNRLNNLDPRMRRDLDLSTVNSPNSYAATNPERTPRSFVTSAPNMTPSRTPNMTPSYMPSIPQLRTPKVMTFEMTPTHQTFELEESTARKHVYAPSFPISDIRERETSVSKDGSHWDMTKSGVARSRRNRWEDSNKHSGSKWEDRDLRSVSGQNDGSRTPRYDDSYSSNYDKYNNRIRGDNCNTQDRRESYTRIDGPMTPIPSFGWSDCPPTPGSSFGRQEAPMTPSHPFGRSDCPTTPVHPFGRGDCPPTPSGGFGRNVDKASNPYTRLECPPTPSHSFGRSDCPQTPSHPFGRSDCPQTPSHPFGRSECPRTPSHPFGRSECPRTPSHPFGRSESISYNRPDISNNSNQAYSKDPRLNRRTTENESSSHNERDYNDQSDRHRKYNPYKSQSKHYSEADTSRSYERERSVGRYDRNYGDRNVPYYDRNRRDVSLGPSTSRDVENNRLYSRNRENCLEERDSNDYYDSSSRRNQRNRSVSRFPDNKQCFERSRSASRAISVGRNTDSELNKDNISFQSDSGRNFTINTSIKSTFQDFLPSGKPIQVFEYSSDARKQRAASVGRSLVRENSVGRTLTEVRRRDHSSHDHDRNHKYKRASSVGRDISKTTRTLQEVKADFEQFRSKHITHKTNISKESKISNTIRALPESKTDFEKFQTRHTEDTRNTSKKSNISQHSPRIRKEDTSLQEQKYNQNRQNYSPKKNCGDPRLRKDHPVEMKSRYKTGSRSDSRDNRKSGIIYSKDSIAKGVMGSGFGVKNYKIPKIKRVEPEVIEVKTKEKEIIKSVEKVEVNKTPNKGNPKTKEKISRGPAKTAVDPVVVKNSKTNKEYKISNNVSDDSETRLTRSKKKSESVSDDKSKDDTDEDVISVKTRKSKKSVIYDSDSDNSVQDKQDTEQITKVATSKHHSPSNKSNTENEQKIMTIVKAPESRKESAIEESLDASFGLDEIFSEHLDSHSVVIDNINALIADLDNDLNTSKNSNDSFSTDAEKNTGPISSPVENILGDISDLIEKDLNKSKESPQTLVADNFVVEQNQTKSDTVQQLVKPTMQSEADINILQNNCGMVDVTKQMCIEKSTTHSTITAKESIVPEQSIIHPETSEDALNITKDLPHEALSKINEDIVSTTEIDQEVDESINLIETSPNKNISDKTNDRLPDSTNEIHCELSSDVTSTNDTTETFSKESDIQSTTSKETFNSIGSILSILQDKSKIKELLAMLGDQSSENEKIKKKLEKLSEIVSDEDEDEEKKLDSMEEKLRDITSEVTSKDGEEKCMTGNINKNEANQSQDEVHQSDEVSPTILIEKNDKIDMCVDAKVESKPVKSSSDDTIHKKTVADEESNFETKTSPISGNENKKESGNNYETNEMTLNNDGPSDTEDNEPLAKKVTDKNKRKKLKGKFQSSKKINKRAAQAAPAKTGTRKRGELQKLQEDINEFMREGILNVTGIRSCRLSKMVSEQENSDSGPVVVLEKVKDIQNQGQPTKTRMKPGPKPKYKTAENKPMSAESDTKMYKPKAVPKKCKPGPKPKAKKSDDKDPYEFDPITDTNSTRTSDDDDSDSENESLTSSQSFGSSEALADTKKKQRRKRRGIGGWQSGIIKSKTKKKKEQKQEIQKNDSTMKKQQKIITIPDLNCFIDKSYCFQKDVTSYDCRLCVYCGTDIVNHYKKQHPHNQIPLSRMDQKTSELAFQQCEQKNFHDLSKISSDKYTCRFCHKEFGNNRDVLETFFWHVVSNHTGEFKHPCLECVNASRCPFNLDIPPPPKDGGQLIGYICQKCNFTQISLENLKMHVMEHHNDEQTEVCKINLAVMSNKAMNAMLRRAQTDKPRVLRSLRSNQSSADSSDIRDDRSDVCESSDHNSDYDPSDPPAEEHEKQQEQIVEEKPKLSGNKIKAKITFENDELSDDSSIKIKEEEHEEITHSHDALSADTINTNNSHRGNSDEIVDYPHFKLNYTESGAKEYVCCINGNDSHYKTSLLISIKKHIQSKHSEKWDGYCCICKVIVTLQGVQSDFKDCLTHFLDKHMDDFPVLEKVTTNAREETEASNLKELKTPVTEPSVLTCILPTMSPPLPVAALSPALPARVATPPVERTASPSYIAVRPLAELISRELIREIEPPVTVETPIALPKIENIVSFGLDSVPPSQPSPSYPTNTETVQTPEKPFLYEEVQAEVMSKKHRVALDAMMSKESLVRVFKCAGRFCSFTTDSPEDALLHASTHQRVGGEGALNCAYCNYDASDNGIDLVMHVFKEHSYCTYCCPLCFYRAAASRLVSVHYAKAHSGAVKLQNVLRRKTASAPPPPEQSRLLTRDVAVQHFVCNHENGACNFKTYTTGKFVEHLQQKHAAAESHPCNLCPMSAASPPELVSHLRSHGLKLYQCSWCVHGANNEAELLAHAAAMHPGTQPQAYVRIITGKEGEKRVLPLACLNKTQMVTEDIAPTTTKENPVKEAERSIDLEKLIALTVMNDSTGQNVSNTENVEEPIDISVESFPDDQDEEPIEPLNIESTTDENVLESTTDSAAGWADKSNTSTIEPPSVKTEPAEQLKLLNTSDIICLDSEDESDASDAGDATPTNEPSTAVNENAQKLSAAVTRNSVTDEVSITKVTEESAKGTEPTQSENRVVENVIDLSDDEPGPSSSKRDMVVDQKSCFKCPSCLQICKTSQTLKRHVSKSCSVPLADSPKCPHRPCSYVARNLNSLIIHYVTAHWKRPKKTGIYFCGICDGSFPSITGAKLHIRSIHKVSNYTVSMGLDENGQTKYTVREADGPTEPVRISGRKTSTEIQRYQAEPGGGRTRKPSTELKKRYGVGDIDKIPISPILDTQVYCELCEFGTKVRLNMVRHLQQHAEKLPVPDSAPVNPVPELKSNEMHFDRMMNLASSSVASRAPDKPRGEEPTITHRIPSSESSRYPKYVPERIRYTCGAKDCSYISLDMAMFRRHWETLHANEEEYRCVHCPPNQALTTSVALSAVRILAHLRMHDVSLYACSACSYYHYRKHLVEKHLAELHVEATVRVVREEAQPEPAAPAAAAPAPTMDLKLWQCGLCDYSSMLRPKVTTHCATEHQSKMQFKCSYCSFRSSAKENVVKHQGNAHAGMPEDVFYYFYKEGSIPDEDGVPLWQRQRLKMRLDSAELKTEAEPEPVPEAPPAPAPITLAPISVDLNIVKEEKPDESSPNTELSLEELCTKFGQFCEPDGIKYKCCLCNSVREHKRETMQCHLYEELNYRRWECVICSYKAFHKNGLHDHMASEHSRQFNPPRALPVDVNIEKWVQSILDHQTKAIESNLSNLSVQKIQGERPTAPNSPKKVESPKPASSASDSELVNAFGDFGTSKNQQFACPKCEFVTKDEAAMVVHLESELSKIRWGCTNCSIKHQTFHEAQFHCKSHTGQSARPKEAIRDPSLRSGWVKAVISTQRQFMKCISETNREPSPDKTTDSEDVDQSENSLLVALYDEPVQIEEHPATTKRPAPSADSDDERLVIDEPPTKKIKYKKCPFCEYNIQNSRFMREHILKEHYNMKPYRCSYCPFEGTRQSVTSHNNVVHSELPKQFITVEVPDTLPGEQTTAKPKNSETLTSTSYHDKDTDALAAVAKTSKRDAKEIAAEEVAKKVCLYCEKSVPETEMESHTHGTEKAEFAKRGEVVVKCCKCLVLRLSITSLQEHFDVRHPGEDVLDNYAYFRLQVDTREIHCCGHCFKKFKFMRDLKVHHMTSHRSLSLSYNSIPFSYNLHTEGDVEIGKRKAEDIEGPSTKRIAKKSTAKPSLSFTFTKNSTTKRYMPSDDESNQGAELSRNSPLDSITEADESFR